MDSPYMQDPEAGSALEVTGPGREGQWVIALWGQSFCLKSQKSGGNNGECEYI
jgi:hypothetical protein